MYYSLHRIEGRERQGGRGPIFTQEQEREIINMVLANNAIRLRELQANIIGDHAIFNNVHQVSQSTLARILKRHQVQMKQLYRVPFERNSERVKRLRHEYVEVCIVHFSTVMLHTAHMTFLHWLYTRPILNYTILSFTVFQGVLQMDAEEILHEFIYIDEAGFNLTKARRRGRNIIGHRAIINVPGQRGGNITLCAAISQHGVLLRHAKMGPYNTPHILAFLDRLHHIVTAGNEMHQMQYTVIWDNVSFHRSALVQNWFQHHPQLTVLYLPPYSPFLNPMEEFFSAWRWKVYDLQPQAQVPLIQAMEDACDQVDAAAVQGWIRHSRRFFPRCLANEDIACDVDEILWPDPARRRDNV